jgi:hypothetical protein
VEIHTTDVPINQQIVETINTSSAQEIQSYLCILFFLENGETAVSANNNDNYQGNTGKF